MTIARPWCLNAISAEVMARLTEAVREIEAGPARFVIVTGAGERAFSAGGDRSELRELGGAGLGEVLAAGHALTRAIETSGKVYVAALNGLALGAGLEIALACDLRVATPEAYLGFPEVTLGILPGAGGTARLPRLVPPAVALEILLTGRRLRADEALRWGLLNRVDGDSIAAAEQLCAELAHGGAAAQAGIKAVVRTTSTMAIDDALQVESTAWLAAFAAGGGVVGGRS